MTEVVLRPGRDEDVDDLVVACNDPVARRFVPSLPVPYTPADAKAWIDQSRRADGSAQFGFADAVSNRLLGAGGYLLERELTAELGYWVAPWARGQGVATAALRQMGAAALSQGIQRLYLRIEPENAASLRVAIQAGFTREGVQRHGGADRTGGGRHDLIVWARLATDPVGPTRRRLPDLPDHRRAADTDLHRRGDDRGHLTDGVVTLRPLRAEDVNDTFVLRGLPEVVNTSVPPTVPDRTSVLLRCSRAESNWLAGDRADFTIRDATTDEYSGEIGLFVGEPMTGQAMIGYSLMPAARGRGFATRAARLVASWAFEEVGMARVIAGVAPENLASQAVLERAGFVREGYQRSRLPGPNNTRIDDILYALLPG